MPTPAATPSPAHSRLSDPFRLAVLRDTGLTGGGGSAALDRLAARAARLAGAPVALVSLVDAAAQHFPGMAGLAGWAADARGTPLTHSFCRHVVADGTAFVVDDAAAHPRVRDNAARTELGVAAYAGVPLTTAAGDTLGALCAIDHVARRWTPDEVGALEDLAAVVAAELERRATAAALADAHAHLAAAEARLARALAAGAMAAWEIERPAGAAGGAMHATPEWGPLFGRRPGEGAPTLDAFLQLVHPLDRPAVHAALADAFAGRAPYEARYRVPLPGGGEHTLHDRGTAECDPATGVVRVCGVVRRVDARAA